MRASAPLDELIARLRELSLVRLEAVLAGVPRNERPELASAFANDLADALECARRVAAELIGRLGAGPGPLSFLDAGAEVRRGAGPETEQTWVVALEDRAGVARDLGRIWSAAAKVVPVLAAAERARRDG